MARRISRKDAYSERIKAARDKLKLTQEEFGAPLGLSWFNIRDLESGKKKVTPQLAEDIEQKHSINMRWLITGNGNMFTRREQMLQETAQAVTNESLRSRGVSLMPCGLYTAAGSIYVPLSNDEACCGSGIMNYEGGYELNEAIPVNIKHIGILLPDLLPFAIQTHGRSMEGYGVREGSMVIVNPAEEPKPGNVVMVLVNEKLAIKKYYARPDGVDFMSARGDNFHVTYEDLRRGDFVHICGRVMLVISPPEDGV